MTTDYIPTPISKEFGAALAAAQSEMESVQRNASNPAFKRGLEVSRYADISAILEAVKPPLNKAGIALTMPALNREDGCVGAYLELRFEGEVIVVPPFWIKPASGIPHAMVSALTYARRAAVTSYFSIPQEDDDGNTASDHGNADRNEYAAPSGKSQRTAQAGPQQQQMPDAVQEAAKKEAAERAEADRISTAKAEADAAAKQAFANFALTAGKHGFNTQERPALGMLARTLTKKDRPGTADLLAAIDLPAQAWGLAIDDTHAALAKAEVDAANLTTTTTDPVTPTEEKQTIGAIAR